MTLELPLLVEPTLQTIEMVAVSGLLACCFGIPLGIVLSVTKAHHILANTPLNRVLGFIINLLRAIPFVILALAMIPLTRLIVGSSIGVAAAIVPLTVAATPFMARTVEGSIDELSFGLVEAAVVMGASPLQIMREVLLSEAMPGICQGITMMLIHLVGYSAMAGLLGAGGLGSLAYHYGYQRFDTSVMVLTIMVLLALVQLIQWGGDHVVERLRFR